MYNTSSQVQFHFAVNHVVKISKARKVFRKGYLNGWTEETFKIYKWYPPNHPTYVLHDLFGKEIAVRFMQKRYTIDFQATEKIIRTYSKGSSRQLLVKWIGFEDSFNF
ncbi:chromo domain-containing protein [Caerostris darwini]|uniref:Chromo domain-containing protein n=1 Tax=Caerostris darwini TaxID=1538125 RepID=A0AAV4PXN6_9ARAC|nr:chromo domain-containing protein [Caerostris darwini]